MAQQASHSYAIRGMVCHRCDLALGELAAGTGVPVTGVRRGAVTFSRELDASELGRFREALEVIGFGLIRDEDERMAEALAVALVGFAERRPIPDWKHAHRELMADLDVPYDYAARAFQQLHDCTPLERLTELRIARAAALLREGELQVSEVAEAVGYSYLSGFSRAFKRVYGMSPSAWAVRGG